MEKGKYLPYIYSNIHQTIIMCGKPNYLGLIHDDITGMLIITSKKVKMKQVFLRYFTLAMKTFMFSSIIHPLHDNFHG